MAFRWVGVGAGLGAGLCASVHRAFADCLERVLGLRDRGLATCGGSSLESRAGLWRWWIGGDFDAFVAGRRLGRSHVELVHEVAQKRGVRLLRTVLERSRQG